MVSLLFNSPSRFVIAFLPRSKCLLISWLQSPSAVILEPKKRISVTVPTLCVLVTQLYPTLWDPMDCSSPGSSVRGNSPGKNTGVGCHALLQGIFPTQGLNPGLLHCRWILYCLSHQRSPKEATRRAYLRWLIFLLEILIPACESSSLTFPMMYSAYKLNKQSDNIHLDVLISQFWTSPWFCVRF